MEPQLEMRPRPRPPEIIQAHIRAQHELVWHLVELAAEFYAYDVRPVQMVGDTVRKIGPDPVPDQLWEALSEEQDRLAQLQIELREARQS